MRLTFLLPLACDTGNGKKGVRESEGSKEPCEIDNTFDRLKEHPVGKSHSHIAHGNTEDEEVKWPSRIFLRRMEEVEWGRKLPVGLASRKASTIHEGEKYTYVRS